MKEGPKEDARHAEYAVLYRLGDESVYGDAHRDVHQGGRIDVGFELPPDTLTLQSSTASSRGR